MTNPSPPEPIAASVSTPVAGTALLERMQADVKALQQQALATQKTIQQLQTDGVSGAEGVGASELPLAPAAWGLAAALAAYALVQLWRRRSANAVDASTTCPPMTQTAYDEKGENPKKTMPPVQAPSAAIARTAAVEPEFADASESDWGVSHSVGLDAQVAFDLQAAANEVARVRKTLADRREARALQREEDARRLRELARRAQREAEDMPDWAESRPAPEVLDVACDIEVASAAKSAPVPFWHRPSERGALAAPVQHPVFESAPPQNGTLQNSVLPEGLAQSNVPHEAAKHDEDEQEGETLPALDNVYAVKLALARESAAVDLWDEARELIDEVLETDDPVLQAQARALLASITQRERESSGGV